MPLQSIVNAVHLPSKGRGIDAADDKYGDCRPATATASYGPNAQNWANIRRIVPASSCTANPPA